MKQLTIFTPTYNRAYIIGNLYDSLCKQTSKDFVWVVVDDGSVDDTEKLINEWISNNEIEIVYYKQSNGGKMRAHNKGVELTSTELFMCVDSDDYLNINSVEVINSFWNDLKKQNKNVNQYAGIVAYRGINETVPMKTEFTLKEKTSTLRNLYLSGFEGDTSLVFRSEVIKQFPFPEIEGEKFVTEAIAYDQIDQKYYYSLLPKVFIICEYLDDGYTKNQLKLERNNPFGWYLFYSQRAKFERGFYKKFRSYAYSNCFLWLSSKEKRKKYLSTWNYRGTGVINLLSIIPAVYLYFRYLNSFKKLGL